MIEPLTRTWWAARWIISFSVLFVQPNIFAQQPGVQEIIEKSVAANHADFAAATHFDWTETDRTGKMSKTSRVTMIEGTPYYRLLAVNGKPLSPAKEAEEERKQQREIAQRRAETPEQRQARIEKFEKERRRANAMMEQLTKAFDFALIGERKVSGYSVYVLRATPRRGYQPPNMETQVLTGMRGELWIDEKAFHWVKVTAQVINPVSIEGFLAEVEPGTRFELEKRPAGDGSTWQTSHFSMKSNARVLHLFQHESSDDETYFNYKPAGASEEKPAQSARTNG